MFNNIPQLLPLLGADEGHHGAGAVAVLHVVVPDGRGGREGQEHGVSQHGLGSGGNMVRESTTSRQHQR